MRMITAEAFKLLAVMPGMQDESLSQILYKCYNLFVCLVGFFMCYTPGLLKDEEDHIGQGFSTSSPGTRWPGPGINRHHQGMLWNTCTAKI